MTDHRSPGAAGALGEGSEATASPEPLDVAEPVEVVQPAGAQHPETSEMSVTMVHRQAPLPAPAELQAYFDISDFVGRTVVEMARDAAGQRHRMERRSFWVIVTVILCVTVVMLAVVAAAVWVATEVSVVGGVLVLLASPTAVVWTLFSRLLRRVRRGRSKPAEEPASQSGEAREQSASAEVS